MTKSSKDEPALMPATSKEQTCLSLSPSLMQKLRRRLKRSMTKAQTKTALDSKD